MRRLTFWVEGAPVGYRREAAAFSARQGRRFTPDAVTVWRTAVAVSFREAALARRAGGFPLDGDYRGRIGLIVAAYGTAADWDNIGKEVSDALKGWAYRDDCQVVTGKVLLPGRSLGPSGGVRRGGGQDAGAAITIVFWDLGREVSL